MVKIKFQKDQNFPKIWHCPIPQILQKQDAYGKLLLYICSWKSGDVLNHKEKSANQNHVLLLKQIFDINLPDSCTHKLSGWISTSSTQKTVYKLGWVKRFQPQPSICKIGLQYPLPPPASVSPVHWASRGQTLPKQMFAKHCLHWPQNLFAWQQCEGEKKLFSFTAPKAISSISF